jgi:hypothetical protein
MNGGIVVCLEVEVQCVAIVTGIRDLSGGVAIVGGYVAFQATDVLASMIGMFKKIFLAAILLGFRKFIYYG